MSNRKVRVFAAFEYEQMRQLIDDACALEGFLCASSGEIERIEEMMEWLQPDVVVFDDRFLAPCLEALTKHFQSTVFIALTSSLDSGYLSWLEKLGVVSIHSQPIKIDRLAREIAAVQEVLDHHPKAEGGRSVLSEWSRDVSCSTSSRLRSIANRVKQEEKTSSHSGSKSDVLEAFWSASQS